MKGTSSKIKRCINDASFLFRGRERIRTAVEAFAELCLATRPHDLLKRSANIHAFLFLRHFLQNVAIFFNKFYSDILLNVIIVTLNFTILIDFCQLKTTIWKF